MLLRLLFGDESEALCYPVVQGSDVAEASHGPQFMESIGYCIASVFIWVYDGRYLQLRIVELSPVA